MGEHDVSLQNDNERLRTFTRALLEDVRVLEQMLDTPDLFETGVRRIGAEQELFVVDANLRPSMRGHELLSELPHSSFTAELGRFNLEINLEPRVFEGRCLRDMEEELDRTLRLAREAAANHGSRIAMSGILPTLGTEHLTLDAMTPNPRYLELNRALTGMRGGTFKTYIKGSDELNLEHDNVMLEACNTSFQVHFQVAPDEFTDLYNLAQIVTAPVLAAAVNSPVLLQHQLWQETRVALFQQSLDSRSTAEQERGHRTRVSFGDRYLDRSMIELLREDIARFRTIIASDDIEDSAEVLRNGGVPRLRAWCMFNGTVYRWNRPCYGISQTPDGPRPHLRIENRVLPAGPSVLDAMANSAFYFGLMSALGSEIGEPTKRLPFEDVKSNFTAASRYGLKARLTWFDGEELDAAQLVLALLPTARRGLESHGIATADIDRYLTPIEERATTGRTGAQWLLDSLRGLEEPVPNKDARYRAVTEAMITQQETGEGVAHWPLAEAVVDSDWRDSFRTVGQIMTRELFTVHPEDLVDLAASMMEWEHVRHVPVEDHDGRLVGIVGHRSLLRIVGRGAKESIKPVAVREIMKPNPITIGPDESTLDAIALMRQHKLACLPVVKNHKLVGIVTEHDFMGVARELLERELSAE